MTPSERQGIADAREQPIKSSLSLFVGKTIERMTADACNQIEFLFTDGTRVALHIECNWRGLPEVMTCTHCATLVKD